MGFIAVQGSMTLEENTGRKFIALRSRVFLRSGKIIKITEPYGAYRTPAIQQYLRNGYLNYIKTGIGPVFYYAAPDGQSNHQGGNAFDIFNWSYVGEQIIKEEAWKLNLVRDASERWHWNNLPGPNHAYNPTTTAGGIDPAGLNNGTVLITLDWTDKLKGKWEATAGARLIGIDEKTADLASTARVNQIHDYEQNNPAAFPFIRSAIKAVADKIDSLYRRVDQIHDYEQLNGAAFPILRQDLSNLSQLVQKYGAPTVTIKADPKVFVDALKTPEVAQALGPAIAQHVVAALNGTTLTFGNKETTK